MRALPGSVDKTALKRFVLARMNDGAQTKNVPISGTMDPLWKSRLLGEVLAAFGRKAGET